MSSRPEQPSPVFVLSCARAGSPLTRFVLDAHPELAAPPEGHLLKAARRLLFLVGALAGDVDDADRWRQASHRTRQLLDQVMAELLDRTGARAWCEKSVSSVDHLDVLDGVYPDAQRIYLHRQALDMVDSGLRATADSTEGYDFEPYLLRWGHRGEALLRYWLDKTEALIEHERTHGGLRLRYKDLVSEPEATLDRLARFLSIDRPTDWQDRIFTESHDPGPGDTSIWQRSTIESKSVGCGAALGLTGIPRTLIRRVNRCLGKLGYSEVGR